jgi:hypothetical protein
MSVTPFKDTKIPYNYRGNFIAEAIRSERYQQTSDWQYLFAPTLTPQEARLNQAESGIACSYIYPLIGTRSGGTLVFNYYPALEQLEAQHKSFMRSYSRLVAWALSSLKR